MVLWARKITRRVLRVKAESLECDADGEFVVLHLPRKLKIGDFLNLFYLYEALLVKLRFRHRP